jgi:hypothetical protein
MTKKQKKNTAVAVTEQDVVKSVVDWTWLTGTKGVYSAPKGAFYDGVDELVDPRAKRYYKQAQAVAKLADEEAADEKTQGIEVERRLRKAAHNILATAIYRQKEVDGVATRGKSLKTLKERKAKCEELLAKLEKEEEDEK